MDFFVDPGKHCKKLMFYDPSRRGDDIVSSGRSEENKRGRNPKMLPVDQLFMTLQVGYLIQFNFESIWNQSGLQRTKYANYSR